MANSTANGRRAKVTKPRPDFPLFPHASGRWAKKVRGRFCYFGKTDDDPKGEAAINLWLDQKDDLLAGRPPRANRDDLTVRELCNHFLTTKEQLRDSGELSPRTFDDYHATCDRISKVFGKHAYVVDLESDDFLKMRGRLARRYGVHRLGNEITRTRSVFKHGYDNDLIEKPVKFGSTFKKPHKKVERAHKQQSPKKLFDAETLRTVIDAADQPLRVMIHLGINCGFGNNDCGLLPLSAVDLGRGWIDYPRPKTAVERRCPLWPETIAEIKSAVARRPTPKLPEHEGLVFITKYGGPWATGTPDSPVSKEFRKLLDKLKLYRPGLSFYALRHTFETIAGQCCDQVAVDSIMGHVDPSMAATYREQISDSRLINASNLVRTWLFGRGKRGES